MEGTPWFTPPEAIKGSVTVDPRSDIYSLGALGYYLLTGHYIFDAESISEIYEKQLAANPVPPGQRTTNPVSFEMEQIILRCLEKEPASRPQSVGELRTLLLDCPAAADWTPEDRVAWWDAYERQPRQPAASIEKNGALASTPMNTVRIELAERTQ